MLLFFWSPASGKKTKKTSGWKSHHETPKNLEFLQKISTANPVGNTQETWVQPVIPKKKITHRWLLEEIRTIFIRDIWSRANRGNEIGLNHGPWIRGFLPSTRPTYLVMRQWSVWTTLPETNKKGHLKKMASQKGRDHLPSINFQIQTVSLEVG